MAKRTERERDEDSEGWYDKTFEEIVAPSKAHLTADQFNSIKSVLIQKRLPDGRMEAELICRPDLSKAEIEAEFKSKMSGFALDWGFYSEEFGQAIAKLAKGEEAELVLSGVIVPTTKTAEGVLVESTSLVWVAIAELLKNDWSAAFRIPPHTWEEIIAGAFHRQGFSVTLTPRSGDGGKDVIAVKPGIGSMRILGSVKAYSPGHLVARAHVHEMLGVVGSDPAATKGIIATTSDFAPRLLDDPKIAAHVPYKLELMNGERLQTWLAELATKTS
jgi:restriction system protein